MNVSRILSNLLIEADDKIAAARRAFERERTPAALEKYLRELTRVGNFAEVVNVIVDAGQRPPRETLLRAVEVAGWRALSPAARRVWAITRMADIIRTVANDPDMYRHLPWAEAGFRPNEAATEGRRWLLAAARDLDGLPAEFTDTQVVDAFENGLLRSVDEMFQSDLYSDRVPPAQMRRLVREFERLFTHYIGPSNRRAATLGIEPSGTTRAPRDMPRGTPTRAHLDDAGLMSRRDSRQRRTIRRRTIQ